MTQILGKFEPDEISGIASRGFAILKDAIAHDAVQSMRVQVLAHQHLMANTRTNPTARHIPGLERFPEFASLHKSLANNPLLNAVLNDLYGIGEFEPIGLSDITINRSQAWHTDLLRGPYATYLTPEMCWGHDQIGCLKALLYLQDGRSLKVVPGSHLSPVSLVDDSGAVPQGATQVESVDVKQGDIVLMDIRTMHRGSTDDDLCNTDLAEGAKILLSTVFGAKNHPLTKAMRIGNAHRMRDWDTQHFK